MGKPRKIQEPHKELRFTRARQAVHFWAIGIALGCAAFAVALLASPWLADWPAPPLGKPWLAVAAVALSAAAASCWLAVRLTRHAFLLLTPIGIEVFPLFFPAKNFRLVMWQEIEYLLVDDPPTVMTVSLVGGGKVFISLAPVSTPQREFLAHAVKGIMEKRADAATGASNPRG